MMKNHLLLSDEAYDAYENMRSASGLREREERRLKEEVDGQQRMEAQNPILKETSPVYRRRQGKYRTDPRGYEAISGEVISQKLGLFGNHGFAKILSMLKTDTDELPETRKFMATICQTTPKLVNAYREMDAEPSPGREYPEREA